MCTIDAQLCKSITTCVEIESGRPQRAGLLTSAHGAEPTCGAPAVTVSTGVHALLTVPPGGSSGIPLPLCTPDTPAKVSLVHAAADTAVLITDPFQ